MLEREYNHTHTTINTHSPGSRSADTHTRAMCVVWLGSTGTAEVRTRRWTQQQNATLVPPVVPTHSHTDNTCPHMHKSRLWPSVPYSYAHNDTLTAELTLVTHTNAQLSTCLYRLNRCKWLLEVELCSRNICPPNPPIYIPHRLQGRGAVHVCMLWDFSAKGIFLTWSYWLKL